MEYEIGCWGTTERTRMSQEEWDSAKSVNCQWLSPFSRLGWVEAFWAIHTYIHTCHILQVGLKLKTQPIGGGACRR